MPPREGAARNASRGESGEDRGEFYLTAWLGNRVVFGSVNANRRHYEAAAAALARADAGWLDGLISRRVPLAHWPDALRRQPDDVKVVIEVAEA